MVRAYWIGPVFGVLAMTGLAWGQALSSVPAPAGEPQDRFVNVQEPGKPAQRCKILKMWTEPNGVQAYQVQALDTGELITIENGDATAPAPGMSIRSVAMRIFHPGRGGSAPVGMPEAPSSAVVVGYPSDFHSTRVEPPLVAAAPRTPASNSASGKWPTAFAQAKADPDAAAAADQHPMPPQLLPLASSAQAPVKKVELTPLAPNGVAANAVKVEPIASLSAPPANLPPVPAPVVVQTMDPKPAAIVAGGSPYGVIPSNSSVSPAMPNYKPSMLPAVGFNASPYHAQPGDGPTLNAPDNQPTASPASVVTGSPYNPNPVDEAPVMGPEIQPEPTISRWVDKASASSSPAMPPPPPMNQPMPAVVQAPTAPVHVETAPGQPSDWRDSWGKIDGPKAPAHADAPAPRVAAPAKMELPHAEVRADDPLKSPDKYVKLPPSISLDALTPDKKAPLLTVAAPEQPAGPAAPPVPAPSPYAPVPAGKPAGSAVDAKPSAQANPAVPLGMASVLAARSPELAPPAALANPKGGSQAEAMGVNANEPNAFTDQPQGGTAGVASNAFSAPQNPAPAKTQADAMAANAFLPPQSAGNPAYGALAMRTPTPRPTAVAPIAPPAYVVPAGYRQQGVCDLSPLTAMLRGSVYPSQREWAVESLASMEWRQQPQVLALLIERAKADPAPAVRTASVRALGRMKADTLEVVEAVKALQSDSDDRVRQEAVETYALLAGTNGLSR